MEEINLLTWKEYAKNTIVFTTNLASEIFLEWEFEFWKIGEVNIFYSFMGAIKKKKTNRLLISHSRLF